MDIRDFHPVLTPGRVSLVVGCMIGAGIGALTLPGWGFRVMLVALNLCVAWLLVLIAFDRMAERALLEVESGKVPDQSEPPRRSARLT